MSWYGYKPYVPVAVRRARALQKMEKLRKKGLDIKPVEIEGRTIARTFWGKAWCDHLESFSDYENRLPRGRTYVRNGSVCHLDIAKGEINAMVSGSEIYTVKIAIKTLPQKKWKGVKSRCAGQVGSLLELLQGKLSKNVMSVVTDRKKGLFPLPDEIGLRCSCPDWAIMCKHVAAVLYGVGARLDETPELLFLLRGVDHEELIDTEAGVAATTAGTKGRRIADDALGDVFGIEISEDEAPVKPKLPRSRKKTAAKSKKTSKATAKKIVKRKAEASKNPSPDKKKTPIRKTKTKAKAKETPRPSRTIQPVTSKDVAQLRKKYGMSQGEFARLLGVSASTISKWEKKPGTLNLQARVLTTWNTVKRLSKKKAWQKLNST